MLDILLLLADIVSTWLGLLLPNWFSGTGCVPSSPSPAPAWSALLITLVISLVSMAKSLADSRGMFNKGDATPIALGVILVVVNAFVAAGVLSAGLAGGPEGACAMSRSITVWTGLATVASLGWNLLSTNERYALWWAALLAGQTAVLLWSSMALRHWALYTMCFASAGLLVHAVVRYRPTSVS